MSDPLDEPLRDLGALWRDPAADAAPPQIELDTQDAETRAAVQWLRSAWRATSDEAAPPIPWELRRRAARRGRSPLRRLALPLALAAAAALALLIVGARPEESRDTVDPESPTTPIEMADGTPRASVVDPTPLGPDPVAARPLTFEPDAFVPRADGLEMVTGKVRVILLNADPR